MMRQIESKPQAANRLFYMAVPPVVFEGVARAIGGAELMRAHQPCWSRVIIEKPFGRDRSTSDRLARNLRKIFTANQIYRIDHYLGKEVIQNLLVLRFANTMFEPVWRAKYISALEIIWHEDIGVGNRGNYFDHYGIIRDVMQNHLLQMLALTTMERPTRLDDPDSIRNAKVRLLRSVLPVRLKDITLGQYRGALFNGQKKLGYLEEKYISQNSITPTYASAQLYIDNPRWRGVAVRMEAGKGLGDRLAEIRVHFKPVPNITQLPGGPGLPANMLVLRVQPDEAVLLNIVNKVPGLKLNLAPTLLDLRYAEAFSEHPIPAAYECLLWEALEGDRSLFISEPELAAAWDVFTPVLRTIERRAIKPMPYNFGSAGPNE